MRKEGFSQLPVLDAGVQVGSLNEIALVRWFQEHPNDKGARVAKLMGQPLPELDISADQAEATRLLLSGHSGILVTENQAPAGILTRSDLVDYWTRRQWSDGGGI
jgi:cystathionine beta-synthase